MISEAPLVALEQLLDLTKALAPYLILQGHVVRR